MALLRRLLTLATRLLSAPRVIYDRRGATPYLSRWYLVGTQPDTTPRGQVHPIAERHAEPWQLYLHRFHRGDDDTALHSHPWAWAVSLVLVGGYWEERRVRSNYEATLGAPTADADAVVRREVRPGTLNVLQADTFHRVDLRDGDCWTLFLVGPKETGWFFWDRWTDITTPWRQFIAELRGADWETENP